MRPRERVNDLCNQFTDKVIISDCGEFAPGSLCDLPLRIAFRRVPRGKVSEKFLFPIGRINTCGDQFSHDFKISGSPVKLLRTVSSATRDIRLIIKAYKDRRVSRRFVAEYNRFNRRQCPHFRSCFDGWRCVVRCITPFDFSVYDFQSYFFGFGAFLFLCPFRIFFDVLDCRFARR